MLPVRVYLDNQDLSRLYKPPNDQLRSIAAELIDMAETGTATFYYSYWHIFEFLQPADVEYLADRRARAHFLKQLCGSNALPFFHDTINGVPNIAGVWMPAKIVQDVTIDLKAHVEEALSARVTNRSMRRKVRSQRAWRAATEAYFRGNTFERSIRFEMGLTDAFVQAAPMSALFKGTISEDQFRIQLGKMFCEPEFFFEHWFVKDHRENPIKNQSIQIGKRWIEIVDQIRETARNYERLRREAAKSRRQYYHQLRNADVAQELKKALAQQLPKLSPPFDPLETLSSVGAKDDRLRYLACYISFHLTSNNRSPTDVVDLMHLFYTEDVDLMRCDRAIFHIMKNCPWLPTSRLVEKLSELPNRIRALAPDGR